MGTKFKGTQGKWYVADYGHCIAVEVELENGQQHTIATDQFCHAYMFDGDKKANAKLISKAPEMLDMLMQFESDLRNGYTIEGNKLSRIQKLINSATEL